MVEFILSNIKIQIHINLNIIFGDQEIRIKQLEFL